MDQYGIDTQILSLTTPSVEFLPAREGVAWATKINDIFAEICRKYEGRFHAFATLPFQQPKACAKELERAYKDLKVKGITIFSNIAGKPIYSPQFYPIYEMAESMVFLSLSIPPTYYHGSSKGEHAHIAHGFILTRRWPWERPYLSGAFERFPDLKVYTHTWVCIPVYGGRINGIFMTV
jgi:predicted TIM-barrel fold metal-dependent hydrolase